MVNETTTTTLSSAILTEILGPISIPAHTPKITLIPLINQDSIDGEGSLTKQYHVDTDLGQAAAGTEGTDFTTNTELTKGTPVQATPTEGAIAKGELTDRAVRRRFPGQASAAVWAAMAAEDPTRFAALTQGEAERLTMMCLEKAEADAAALLGALSNTVGTSGTDIGVVDMVNALFTMKTLEPVHEDMLWYLWPNQLQELTLELGVTTGGLTGAVWFQQADASFINMFPDDQRNGLRGSFLRVPVYEGSHSLRVLVNVGADVAGALMLRGQGAPDVPNAQLSPFCFTEGAPLRFDMDTDASKRASELLCIYEYAAVEIDDANAVGIYTDAP